MIHRTSASIVAATLLVLTTARALPAGDITGKVVDMFDNGLHEGRLFVNGTGNQADTTRWGVAGTNSGNFLMANIPGGQYWLAFDEYAINPQLILDSPINVPGSGTLNLNLKTDPVTFSSEGLNDLGSCLWAAQSFIATGRELELIENISPNTGKMLHLTIREGGPNGTQVGPPKEVQTGGLFPPGSARWKIGEVPLVPGRQYFARFDAADSLPWRPAISYRKNPYPNGNAWWDGVSIPEADLRMGIRCRDNGFIEGYRTNGHFRNDAYSEYVQTFAAEGPELRTAKLMIVGGTDRLIRATLHEWNGSYPPGAQIGPAKTRLLPPGVAAQLFDSFVWGPGEAPVAKGITYALKFVQVGGGTFGIFGNQNDYPLGQCYFDGSPINGHDILSRMIFKEIDRGDVNVSNIIFTPISATEVQATFQTDLPTSGTIAYRKGAPVFDTIVPAAPTLLQSHTVVARHLEPNTSYQMYVLVYNASKNVFKSTPVAVQTTAGNAPLTGRVVTQVGGAPNAELILEELGLTTFTNANGEFTFPGGVWTGRHTLKVRGVGLKTVVQTVDVPDGPGLTGLIIATTAYTNLLAGTDSNPAAGWTEYQNFGGEMAGGAFGVPARTGSKWVGTVKSNGATDDKTGGMYPVLATEHHRTYRSGGGLWPDPAGGTDPSCRPRPTGPIATAATSGRNHLVVAMTPSPAQRSDASALTRPAAPTRRRHR